MGLGVPRQRVIVSVSSSLSRRSEVDFATLFFDGADGEVWQLAMHTNKGL